MALSEGASEVDFAKNLVNRVIGDAMLLAKWGAIRYGEEFLVYGTFKAALMWTVSVIFLNRFRFRCDLWSGSAVQVEQEVLWQFMRRPDFKGKTSVLLDVIIRNSGTSWDRSLGCGHKALLLVWKVRDYLVLEIEATNWQVRNYGLNKKIFAGILGDLLIFKNRGEVVSLWLQLEN